MKRLSLATMTVGLSALLLAGCMTGDESNALNAVNADRATIGAGALVQDGALVTKAQNWARHLADSSGGTCSGATLSHSDLRDGAPAGWRALGENVGCRVAPGPIAAHVSPLEASFMASPHHRDNIMNRGYNAAGIGLASVPAAIGHGWIVVYETQEFATL
jgi:uncharacterized protein YkwD